MKNRLDFWKGLIAGVVVALAFDYSLAFPLRQISDVTKVQEVWHSSFIPHGRPGPVPARLPLVSVDVLTMGPQNPPVSIDDLLVEIERTLEVPPGGELSVYLPRLFVDCLNTNEMFWFFCPMFSLGGFLDREVIFDGQGRLVRDNTTRSPHAAYPYVRE